MSHADPLNATPALTLSALLGFHSFYIPLNHSAGIFVPAFFSFLTVKRVCTITSILVSRCNTDRLYSLRVRLCRGGTSCLRHLRCRTRGAICARLACASTDSLALDYVAFGSTGRAVLRSRLNGATTKKRQPQGLPLFCWWTN